MGIEKNLKGRGLSLFLEVKKSPILRKDVVKRAGYQLNTFYTHIKKENLDYAILAKYGAVIKHNFALEYPEMADFFPFEEKGSDYSALDIGEYNSLKEKYLRLLESHKELLSKYHDLEIKWMKRDS